MSLMLQLCFPDFYFFNYRNLNLGYTGSPEWIACVQEFCDPYPVNCTQEPINYAVTIILNNLSDGFICEDSQIWPNSIEQYEARDANHSEEVIHPNVQNQIRASFDRPDFFMTQ